MILVNSVVSRKVRRGEKRRGEKRREKGEEKREKRGEVVNVYGYGTGNGMMMIYIPGGVISVATANALKAKWPAVYQKYSLATRLLDCFLYMKDGDGGSVE